MLAAHCDYISVLVQPFIFSGIQIAFFPFKNLLSVMFLHSLVPTFSRRVGLQKFVLFYVIFFLGDIVLWSISFSCCNLNLRSFRTGLHSCWPRYSHHCHTGNSFHISSWGCIPHFLGVLHSFISVSSVILGTISSLSFLI